jgi:methylmalonyl-CoA/ethylmalonyl-CoA epimerase
MTNLAIKPHHLGVSVPDMDAALEWYHSMLGFELESRVYMAIIPADVAFIRNGDFRLELFQVENSNPLPDDRRFPNQDVKTHGNKHICLSVQDVVGTVASLKEKGADIVFQKKIQGTEMAFIRDVAGNLIELMECPELW